ncbi:MAG TPA: sulfotransferase [Acidimicrobiales bacterium]|nr:sulfotransferase [Acidimicrobiales bacterium]
MLHVGALIEQAVGRTGSDDFGVDTWQQGLEVLVRSFNEEASLTELGERVVGDQIVGFLANRLEVERWYRQHPEIDDGRIQAPLFGLGLPRTGSTALSFLLAADRRRRCLRTWEANEPCPPPTTATEESDPRIARTQAGLDIVNDLFPDFAGMLPRSATGPQECLLVMALDFRSMVFEGYGAVPSYAEWLLSCDMVPAYRYHKRVLKLLQWHCGPRRWWLKSPAHMASIKALDAVYPDARFVMTHRDVSAVMASLCALKHALRGPLTLRIDTAALGRGEASLWENALQQTLALRDAGLEERFFDVSFDRMQAAPLDAVAGLYGALGDELDDDTLARMAKWWEESASERRSGTSPDPATYGLDKAELRARFAFYHSRFRIDPGD